MTVDVQASYIGDYGKDGHWVSVKKQAANVNSNPVQIVRKFHTQEAANSYVNLVNSSGHDVFERSENNSSKVCVHCGDEYIGEHYCKESEPQCGNISFFRALFSKLTNEQIAEVNRCGKLPEGTKFIRNESGGYTIGNNIFGLRTGTRVLPEGYELRRDAFGFTAVVPKGSEGLLLQ